MAIKREKVVKTAEKLVQRGKIEAAIKEYRKVLAENPNDANTLNRVGDLYARIERFDEAVHLFSQIADQYTKDGFFVKAIAIYKKILKLAPSSLQVYERLAELYFQQGLVNESRSQFQILADHYEKRDNAASAITIYQRMTEIDPENPQAYLKLAQLYREQQLTEKALRAYRQLANLFLVNGSIDEATQVYMTALDAYHQEVDFFREVVSDLHNEGHTEAAQRLVAKARGLNPAAASIAEVLAEPEPEPMAEPEPELAEEPEPPTEEITFDAPAPAPGLSSSTVDFPVLEDDSVFTLDLESDTPAETEVRPPPDMAGVVAEEEFDLDLPGSGGAGALFAGTAPAPEAPDDFEIEWPRDEAPEDEIDVELEDEIEVELEDAATAAPSAPAAVPPAAEPPAADTLADTAAEAAPPARHEEDLLAEAAVFAKYGLREKAEDRLQELLNAQPDHLGGLCLLARLDLEAGRRDEALERANAAARAAASAADPAPFRELKEDLARAGLQVEDAAVPEPSLNDSSIDSERFAQLLEDLDETSSTTIPVQESLAIEVEEPPEVEAEDIFGEAEDIFGEGDVFGEEPVPVESSPAAAEEPATELEALMAKASQDSGFEELSAESLGDLILEEPAPATPAAETPREPSAGLVSLADELGLAEDHALAGRSEAASLDETGMSWLDDVETPAAKAEEGESLFDEEDDFFDLAAELEAEFGADGLAGDEDVDLEQPQEQDLKDIIDGFKKGVAENLSAEDYDTHFNLGIAYREMGLLDEAIGEFQLASKDPRYIVECSSMLGICFLEKGLPELAVRWYKKGLESPTLADEQALGLLYDMASAYLTMGDGESAYRTYIEIYGMNSNYRDVAQRIQELSQPAES